MSTRNTESSRQMRLPQVLAMLLAFFLAAGTGGILLAGLALPFAASAGTVTTATTGLFGDLPTDFKPAEPSEASTIYASDGSVLAKFYAENRINVKLDKIAPTMRQAIVATEDRRFYQHNGVDLEGMARALLNNLGGGETEGASSLTQQYVKNVFMERARVLSATDPVAANEMYESATAQSYGRKIQEARYAIALEQRYSKEQILEGYLNIAQFGPSVYGVEAASQHYFGHSADTLSVSEAALLAGLPQSPNTHDPLKNPASAKARRDTVLAAMKRDAVITDAQYQEALAKPIAELIKNHKTAPNGCATAGNAAYFCQYVVHEVYNSPAFGKNLQERKQVLLRGGLQIHTTLEPARQQAAYDAVVGTVPVGDPSGINIALSSVEPGTGRIRAMAQNTNFGSPKAPGDSSRTELNLNADHAHGGGEGFQTGSTFKAIIVTEWLRTGHSLLQVVPADIKDYPRNQWNISCKPENAATYNNVRNLENATGSAFTVTEAVKKSVNRPFVWMATKMDLCGVASVAESMGMRKGNGKPLEIIPSMALGTNTIAPLQMANAFATYAAGGKYCPPFAIERVVRNDGTSVPIPANECKQVLSPEIANAMNHVLQQVTKPGGTGSGAALPDRPAAGKTGTADRDYHAWFVGYTPQLSAAVWMGHAKGYIPMLNVRINGRFYSQVYGGRLPAPTWRVYMERALQGTAPTDFAEASDLLIHGEQIPVPSVVGRTPDAARQILEAAGFSVQISSQRVYSDQPAGAIARQSPTGRAPKSSMISLWVSDGPDPANPNPQPSDKATSPDGNPSKEPGKGRGKKDDD